MFITRKRYNEIINKYEKRIDDLLNRLMSTNYSEYKFVKAVPEKPKDIPEPSSRSDADEYKIEQDRLNSLKELNKKAEGIKTEMLK